MILMFYGVLIAIIVGDMLAARFMHKKLRALDPSKPESAAQEKRLRQIVLIIHVQAFLFAALLIFFIKPLLIGA
jgi:hypothetical protein